MGGILGKVGRLCRLSSVEIVVSGNSAAIRRSEACQSGRMGLPAKELSLRGPQVQILSPPQLRQSASAPELPTKAARLLVVRFRGKQLRTVLWGVWCACGGPLGLCRREALCRSFQAPVAQRIEHLTTDQKVGGSNPSGRTIFPLGICPVAGGLRRSWGFCSRGLGSVALNLAVFPVTSGNPRRLRSFALRLNAGRLASSPHVREHAGRSHGARWARRAPRLQRACGSMGAVVVVWATVAVALASASAQCTPWLLRPPARFARRGGRPPPFRSWCTASFPWWSRELLHSRDGPGALPISRGGRGSISAGEVGICCFASPVCKVNLRCKGNLADLIDAL